jgi:putative CocE/NonD family hydrolase
VWASGRNRWHDLPEWPPPDTSPRIWYLRAGGSLADVPASDGVADGSTAVSSALRYDPADPTPAVGGRLMSVRNGGSRNNTAIESRADVVTFSTAPLAEPIEVAGVPLAEVYVSSDNPHCDVFIRLCDVDERGRSRNLTDQILRCSPAEVVPGEVRRIALALTDVSHVFRAGHRIRLQIAGGAHPRFARNLGTDADPLTGTRTAPVTHQVQHGARYPSALTLPVAAPAPASRRRYDAIAPR